MKASGLIRTGIIAAFLTSCGENSSYDTENKPIIASSHIFSEDSLRQALTSTNAILEKNGFFSTDYDVERSLIYRDSANPAGYTPTNQTSVEKRKGDALVLSDLTFTNVHRLAGVKFRLELKQKTKHGTGKVYRCESGFIDLTAPNPQLTLNCLEGIKEINPDGGTVVSFGEYEDFALNIDFSNNIKRKEKIETLFSQPKITLQQNIKFGLINGAPQDAQLEVTFFNTDKSQPRLEIKITSLLETDRPDYVRDTLLVTTPMSAEDFKQLVVGGSRESIVLSGQYGILGSPRNIDIKLKVSFSKLELFKYTGEQSVFPGLYAAIESVDSAQQAPFSEETVIFLGTKLKATPPTKEKFTVGTVNVENLWDDDHGNQCAPKSVPDLLYRDFSIMGSNWYEPGVITSKVDRTVEMIEAMNADVAHLVEIEYNAYDIDRVWSLKGSRGKTLKEMLQDLGYREFKVGTQNEDGYDKVSVTTAIISKLPMKVLPSISGGLETDLQNIQEKSIHYSKRDFIVTDILSGDNKLRLIGGHFKSKRGGETGKLLQKLQARNIRNTINHWKAQDPDLNVVVLGDLNTHYYEDVQTQHLNVTGNEAAVYNNQTSKLYNLWYEIKNPDNRWSDVYNGKRDALMHMAIDASLYNGQGVDYVDNSYRVIGFDAHSDKNIFLSGKHSKFLNAFGVPLRQGKTSRGRREPVQHSTAGYSDHLAIVADFKIAKSKKQKFQPSSFETLTQKPTSSYIFPSTEYCDAGKSQFTIDKNSSGTIDFETLRGQCVTLTAKDGFSITGSGRYTISTVSLGSQKIVVKMADDFNTLANRIAFPGMTDIPQNQLIERCSGAPQCDRRSDLAINRYFLQNIHNDREGKILKAVGIFERDVNTGEWAVHLSQAKNLTTQVSPSGYLKEQYIQYFVDAGGTNKEDTSNSKIAK